ncbi:MAG: hypothetical protein QM725_05655 [Lacibacter sp.]
MKLQVLVLLIICNLIFGCTSEERKQDYKYRGQVSFRRSYAGHENLSDKELDSLRNANPLFMEQSNASEDTLLAILVKSGMVKENELLLDKISSELKDTIFISSEKSGIDTAYISYNQTKESGMAVIHIRNGKLFDTIPISDEVFSHTFSLARLNYNTRLMFVFVNQYYIMNGDNYEVSVYEKK